MPKLSKNSNRPRFDVKTTLMLFTAISSVLLIIRINVSETIHYAFLWWNLFLAAVPLGFSVLGSKKTNHSGSFVFMMLWLFFYPNSPYILTDYIHLGKAYSEHYMILDTLTITFFSIAGLLFGFVSLDIVLRTMQKMFSTVIYYPALIAISILTGIGLYLGRYLRFNSWDILSNPIGIFNRVIESFFNTSDTLMVSTIVALFTIVHVGLYFAYRKVFYRGARDGI